ncbi:MAG: CHAT domain-containing protein [Candidatus Aminicenantes bacterium]|nr:CHAT domain-containing protein [Candidatus Aminicenantes bacterium]
MERRSTSFFAGGVFRSLISLTIFMVLSGLLASEDRTFSQASGLETGIRLREQGRYEQSLEILEKEINSTYSKENPGYRGRCWLNLALDYWNLGEVSRAENAFIYVLALVGEIKDEGLKDYAQTALHIIKLYREGKAKKGAKQYKVSEKMLKAAQRLAKDKGLKDLELKCLFQLSFAYFYQNYLQSYFECNSEVVRIAEEIRNYYDLFRGLNNIGTYYFINKNILKSHDYFDRALVLAEKEKLLPKDPVILFNLAVTSSQLGLYDLSENYIERALEFYQKGDDLATTISLLSQLAISIHKKTRMNGSLPNRERPRELLSTALELSRQAGLKDQEAEMLNNLGFVLLEVEPERARTLCLQSLKLGEELGKQKVIAASLNNLATLSFKENDIDRAQELYSRALSIALKVDYWSEIWTNYYGLARCLERRGKYEKAFQTYQKALEALAPVRDSITFDLYRIRFDRSKKDVYEGLIRSLVKYRLGHPGQRADKLVFSALNNIKARVFMEELSRLSSGREGDNQVEELNKLDRMISDFVSQSEKVQDETAFSRLAELEYRYLRLRELNGHGQAALSNSRTAMPGLEQVQKEALSGNELVLDFFLGKEASYCFVISRDHFRIIQLPVEQEIEKSIRLYIKLLASPAVAEEDLRMAGRRIAQLLLPVEDLRSKKFSSLIIIPDGHLNWLPFETLIVDDPKYPEGRYLVESHNVYYIPALAMVNRYRVDDRVNGYGRELLAFGNPYHSRWFNNQVRARIYFAEGIHPDPDFYLGSLPFSQKEIKQLAKLFPKNSCDLFLRKKASEDNLKSLNLSRYRIIHFACHGLISEKFPQRSSLVLSSFKKSSEDGFLTAREIYTLRLNSELVVLAACQSSRGTIERAEGVIGLPRIFLLAGSQAVISSLWSVNDRSSQELMLQFYRSLLDGQSKDEALRQAKLRMMRKGKSHPYYWAGYILTGDARSIY